MKRTKAEYKTKDSLDEKTPALQKLPKWTFVNMINFFFLACTVTGSFSYRPRGCNDKHQVCTKMDELIVPHKSPQHFEHL